MSTFDTARYDREVIGPLRGRHGRLPPGDLRVRYAIEPGMDRSAIEERLRKVRMYWNQKATGPAAQAATRVCQRLLAADEEIVRSAGARMLDPTWWQQQAAEHGERAKAAVTDLVRDLRDSYGGTGRITRQQLAAIVTHHQASLRQGQIDSAVQQARLAVVDPVELPQESGIDRTAYRSLSENLAIAGVPTIVQLLHPDLRQPFRLAHGFAVPGRTELRLDAATVDQQTTASNTAAFSSTVQARKNALVALRTAAKQGRDLTTLALYQVVEQLRQGRANGLADRMLVRGAVELGLAAEDAELLVLSLPAVSGTPVSAAGQVRELLGRGELRTAAQRLTAVPAGDPDREAIRQEIADAERRLTELLAEADRAAADDREELAEQLLRRAAATASDDEQTAGRLRRLRPPPPEDLRIEPAARTALRWTGPTTGLPDLRYRVVRGAGGPPATPGDGTLVAETAEVTAVDTDPLVARPSGYAVFVASGTGTWSRPVAATVTVAPPVGEVTIRATRQRVSAAWRTHPAVVAVRVRRTEGRRPTSATDGVVVEAAPDGLTDDDVREGVEYFYSLVAVYRDEDSREVASTMVTVSAAPRPTASAVETLTVEPVRVDGNRARVRLSWVRQPAIEVRVRRAATRPTWQPGSRLSISAIDGYGTEVTGPVVDVGERSSMEADVPLGFHIYVPFAVGGEGVLAGRSVAQGLANPVDQLRVERVGDRVAVSWVWPEQVSIAEVSWERDGRSSSVTRVTRNQYVQENGCRLSADARPGRVTVVGITAGANGEARSPAVVVDVPGRAARLRYTIARPAGLRNRLSRRRVVTVTAEAQCSVEELIVVARPGPVMPVRPAQGTEIVRASGLDFSAGQSRQIEFELPPDLPRPYWIRCFVEPPTGVTLVDPPVDHLRV
ncbi:hypothetical protein OG792_05735 [Micromonospora sp. NBC_01699]|uniref:hypothetical protein n=1 Tax=Micromonospora sp. NBC_01699 TaxID=2975984 RepID=UPI002E33637A|nr:hypothetical protein [Micromonospora sp. NBC_01699]